mmetsp:Transcript_23009/g.40657  ORF Transcript_23009/g.40657 Transcript_23009/m.40657 type:complete len:500 (+) Transcript_23009:68-1567(+)
MWKLLGASALWACRAVEGEQNDASCMLQAHVDAQSQLQPKLVESWGEMNGCPAGTERAKINFNSFAHGEVIGMNSIPNIKISLVTPGPSECKGPPMVLDPKDKIRNDDLTAARKKMLVYSKDGPDKVAITGFVNDCRDVPGAKFIFEFTNPVRLRSILLWDVDNGVTKVELFDENDNLLLTKMPSSNNNEGADTDLERTDEVKKLSVQKGGSSGIVSIRACLPPGSGFGDPHIYALDGNKFDLYENGTYNFFRYSGRQTELPSTKKEVAKTGEVDWQMYTHSGGHEWAQQGLLLVDHSFGGKPRQALELSAKDCIWRSKIGKADWAPVKNNQSVSLLEGQEFTTGFHYFSEKHLALRMNTVDGVQDTINVHAVCKPEGINVKVHMPDWAESRFVQGQIEVGNGKRQKTFKVKETWTALGGSEATQKFYAELRGETYSLITACSSSASQRTKAEKICEKHLHASSGSFFDDCVSDVCRGGEKYAISAAEMLAIPVVEEDD